MKTRHNCGAAAARVLGRGTEKRKCRQTGKSGTFDNHRIIGLLLQIFNRGGPPKNGVQFFVEENLQKNK